MSAEALARIDADLGRRVEAYLDSSVTAPTSRALIADLIAALIPEPPTDEPCAICGWTGPRTQYLGIERLPVAHPDGDHPADWLRAIRRPEPPTNDEREPLAWAVYGRKTGRLRYVVTDEEEAASLSEHYDLHALWRNRHRVPITDEAVDRVAAAIAKAADADYWVDDIAEWENSEEWERAARADDYPQTAYEDRAFYRMQASAALEAGAAS